MKTRLLTKVLLQIAQTEDQSVINRYSAFVKGFGRRTMMLNLRKADRRYQQSSFFPRK